MQVPEAAELESFDPGLLEGSRRVARGASVAVVASSVLVLAGWTFDVEVLRSLVPGLTAMNPGGTAVALLATAEGSAIVTENIYDGRFQFVDELARMGADVRTEGRHAVVRGGGRLSGAPVAASDVRAGAALVLAGLVAEGETIVHECHHIDRGYPDLPAQLRALGADVERLD